MRVFNLTSTRTAAQVAAGEDPASSGGLQECTNDGWIAALTGTDRLMVAKAIRPPNAAKPAAISIASRKPLVSTEAGDVCRPRSCSRAPTDERVGTFHQRSADAHVDNDFGHPGHFVDVRVIALFLERRHHLFHIFFVKSGFHFAVWSGFKPAR